MAAPDRRADIASPGCQRPAVPQGLCVRLAAIDSGIGSRDRSGVWTRAACREAIGLRLRAPKLHQRHEGCSMKVFNFHLMPYRHADLDAIEKNGSAWVTLSNQHYDPQKGADLYHEYLEDRKSTRLNSSHLG